MIQAITIFCGRTKRVLESAAARMVTFLQKMTSHDDKYDKL